MISLLKGVIFMSIIDKLRKEDTPERRAAELAKMRQMAMEKKHEIIESAKLRFNTYCIGVGRAGIHFLDAIYEVDTRTNVNQVFPLALPSSKYDYQMADNLNKREEFIFPFGASDRDVRYTGVGGDQHLGQEIAIEEGRRILSKAREDIETIDREVPVKSITLIGSLAGGTGGGGIPVLAKMIKDNFPDQLIIIMGILPERQEGNAFLVNASRSFNMIMNLRNELADKYIDVFFLFENTIVRKSGMLQSYDKINHELASTFNLLFGSTYSPDTQDPHDKLKILKKGGSKGVGMMRYVGDQEVDTLNPQTDMEVEDAKSEIVRMLKKNLAEYPAGTAESGRYGIYQVRCDQNIFPFDVRNILTNNFEVHLQKGGSDKVAFVKGGIWPNPGSNEVDIATMILGIDYTKYDYLRKVKEWWRHWYEEEDVINDFQEILSTEVVI